MCNNFFGGNNCCFIIVLIILILCAVVDAEVNNPCHKIPPNYRWYFFIDFFTWLSYNQYCDLQFLCRCGGMADATDSKSVVGNNVWVQVPPPVPCWITIRNLEMFLVIHYLWAYCVKQYVLLFCVQNSLISLFVPFF